MQAYRVSKRPPRALFLGLAIALGVVAVSAAVLPSLGNGGLLRDGTYLRLLGYAPSDGGAGLTASSAEDAREGRVILSAAPSPAPTPAPPETEVSGAEPTDPPADATSAEASESEQQTDPVGTDVPALREVNETFEDLDAGLEAIGLGVLPTDAGDVRGAPDATGFIDPRIEDDRCTWTREFEGRDDNRDGNPEWVRMRMLGVCTIDEDADDLPEARLTVARDVQVWDNDSDGHFNALEARQGLEAFVDPNENGVYEYTAQAVWTLSAIDENADEKPESAMATFAGEQRFDRNESGNAEFVRTVRGEICMIDEASDGTPESVDIELNL